MPGFKPRLSGVKPRPPPGCWAAGLHNVALRVYTDDLICPHRGLWLALTCIPDASSVPSIFSSDQP